MTLFTATITLLLFGVSTTTFANTVTSKKSEAVGGVRIEPQVIVTCDERGVYNWQYFNEHGVWTTSDYNGKPNDRVLGCNRGKKDILDYCKQMYPNHDITNIVMSAHPMKLEKLCDASMNMNNNCKETQLVNPYRCLVGPFQSDALLVPDGCVFDHIHNQSQCWLSDSWNQTAAMTCQKHSMVLRTYAMLLPCGISLFSGVEFVCCPDQGKVAMMNKALETPTVKPPTQSKDDDDDDDAENSDDVDMYDEGYDDNTIDFVDVSKHTVLTLPTVSTVVTSQTTTVASTTSPPSTPDPYFIHFDPRREHLAYKEAKRRMGEVHKEKVTKVMKEWSDLEEHYQQLKSNEPRKAENFMQRMTEKFQGQVQELEEEEAAERHQLMAMHQQRITAHINQLKKEAMKCYMASLEANPPVTHQIQKCLQKLVRSLQKDRHHTIAHYRHMLASSVEQADRERPVILEHLLDIDRTMNQSLQMLQRFPSTSNKISQTMLDYVEALRSKDEAFPLTDTTNDRDTESAILEKYRAEILKDQQVKKQFDDEGVFKDQLPTDFLNVPDNKPTDPYYEKITTTNLPATSGDRSSVELIKDFAPHVAHSLANDISHNEPLFSVKSIPVEYRRHANTVYFAMLMAVFALIGSMFIAVAIFRKKMYARSPQNQGFIQVEQNISPEERHVANMQINGYENPTYKYFEVKE